MSAPNGGEAWTGATVQNIQWAAADPAGVDSVNIDLSTDGGATFATPIAHGVPNTGSFAWSVPDTSLPACRVRVTAFDAWRNPSTAASAADFAIAGATAVGPLAGLAGFDLAPVWPNPSRGAASVRFVAPRAANVALAVYDLAGRRVRTLVSPSSPTAVGEHVVAWDGRDDAGRSAAPGVYFARLALGPAARAQRFALVR